MRLIGVVVITPDFDLLKDSGNLVRITVRKSVSTTNGVVGFESQIDLKIFTFCPLVPNRS